MLLQGILCAYYGLIALLWAPLGSIFGIWITAQMVLPLLFGLPTAYSLVSKKQMRPTVYLALFRTPIIWCVLLFALGFIFAWLFPTGANWLLNNEPLKIAGYFGFVLILFSPLSKKMRADIREDFDKAWGNYYTKNVDSKTVLKDSASFTDPKQRKQVEAAIKIFSNLYTHTTNKDVVSKCVILPDAKFRYMIFCMSSFIYSCEDIIYERETFKGDCIGFLSVFMTSRENAKKFFDGEIDFQELKQSTPLLLREYLNNWASYNNSLEKNDTNLANSILCEMMHSTMTNEPLRETDRKGLEAKALSIVEMIPVIRSAFVKLT